MALALALSMEAGGIEKVLEEGKGEEGEGDFDFEKGLEEMTGEGFVEGLLEREGGGGEVSRCVCSVFAMLMYVKQMREKTEDQEGGEEEKGKGGEGEMMERVVTMLEKAFRGKDEGLIREEEGREEERKRYAAMLVVSFLCRYYPSPVCLGAFSSSSSSSSSPSSLSLSSFLVDLFSDFVKEVEGKMEKKEGKGGVEVPLWVHPLIHSLLVLLRSPFSVYAPSSPSSSSSSILSSTLAEKNALEEKIMGFLVEENKGLSPFSHHQKHVILEKTISLLSHSSLSSPSHVVSLLMWVVAILSFTPSLLPLVASREVICNLVFVDAKANYLRNNTGLPPFFLSFLFFCFSLFHQPPIRKMVLSITFSNTFFKTKLLFLSLLLKKFSVLLRYFTFFFYLPFSQFTYPSPSREPQK